MSASAPVTAPAENHVRGNPDLDDTIARLQAYERAGADVLYAPGLRSGDEIRAVCEATSAVSRHRSQ
jgi:2-methylisocitrate lyase-like PEP mutase family enzyme